MQPCCENPENRSEPETRGDLTVTTCRACGRRHFELTVDPLRLTIREK